MVQGLEVVTTLKVPEPRRTPAEPVTRSWEESIIASISLSTGSKAWPSWSSLP